MSDSLPDLDPDALALLRDFQTVGQRSPAAIDAALKTTLGAAAGGAAVSAAATSSVVLKVVGAVLLCGAVGVAGWVATRSPAEAPGSVMSDDAVVRAEPRVPAGVAAPVALEARAALPQRSMQEPANDGPSTRAVSDDGTSTAPIAPLAKAQVEPPRGVRSGRQRRSANKRKAEPVAEAPTSEVEAAPATSPASLVAELRLLRRARAALKKHDPKTALTVAAEHRRDFPAGELAEERDATEITALCQLGRRPEAETKATVFGHAHPRSKRDVLGACVAVEDEAESL